ncbi:hypothetical protein LWI29_018605 [Acer saccharum]|uniref:At1g61320/AtMIF1 LRR domain-containing protein n=1 Tax=Acer saccharum TaxID=4024 RepID=A0AA39SW51_ACESA|nr:hypothetical protein LWI29_018605 [Acer saccharum]
MYTLPRIIFSAASVNALKLEGCKLEHIPEIIRLYSPKSLILKKVAINEEIVQKFTSQCPLLEDFSLDYFWGLKHISVKPQKLKICSICGPVNELKSVEIAAPSLQQLEITCGIHESIIIDVVECSNLKVLKLKGINLIDQEFHRLMSKVSMLEDLTVSSCALIERITISSDRLKKLSISYCFKLKKFEIDTPNLLSFYYRNHPILTSIVNAPCPWELHFKNAIDELGNKVDPDAQWFLNMKDFLRVSNQIRSIAIAVRSKRDSFNFEEFRNNLSSLPCEVERLRVRLDAPPSSFAALLDGLFGVRYSRKFYVYIGQELHRNFIEWLYNEMVNRDDNSCNSRNIKCWRHYLKDFKIKGFLFYPSTDSPSLNRKPLDVNEVMDLWPKLPDGILQCRLDWCFPESIEFTEFVDAFLVRFSNLKLCMQKFRLLICFLEVEASPFLLDKWIGLAVRNEVKEIDLNVQTYKNAMYTLPRIIFSAASVNALKLEGCKLEHIPEIIRLYSPKSLILKKVAINEEIVQKFTSQCPLLEDLKVSSCVLIERIRISSYRLKRLSISYCFKLKKIEIDTPNLLFFYYRNHPILTSIVYAPCPWELHFKNAIDESMNKVDPDAQWFLNMKDFLGVSNQIRFIVIDVRSKRVHM